MSEVTVNEGQAGRSVEARPGDRVVVLLEENPTSGYRWDVDRLDGQLLDVQSSDFVPADDSQLGGGGTRRVTLLVKSTGSSDVALKLWRDWEGEGSVSRRFDVTIEARP
jgi:inhibitor of cysteine peptidase